MATYSITFTIHTDDDVDPSGVLDGAESATDDLIGHLGAVDIDATPSEDGPCVTEVDD